jgi:UDP-N-acetylmuramate--alanine ligase
LPIEGVTSHLIYYNLKEGVAKQIIEKTDIIEFVKSRDFDVLVILGAGDLDNRCDEIAEILNSK